MHELNELELAIRSERHATLACDGIPFTVRTVIDNESGTFVFPVESSALGGEEVVLWLPEERNDAMQVLVMLDEIDGELSASADRWRIYHGSPGQSHWVSASLLAVRFGTMVADAEQIDLTNPLAPDEPRLCKKYNTDHDLLGTAARTMDPRATGEGVLVGVDPMGFDIRTRFDIVRVPFGERLVDAEKADARVHNLLSELSAAG